MSSAEADTWNTIVTGYSGSKMYHLHEWGTLLQEIHGHKLVYLQEDNGVFPLACVKSRIFGPRLISLPFADYGGPCAADSKTVERLISRCEEAASELGVDFIEIRSPDSQYFETIERHGFVRRDDYFTFVLRLDSEIEKLWKGIGDKNRNMVRKSEKSGVQVVAATSKADLKAFHLLYQKTMKKLGSPPQSYRFFERIWDLFYPQNMTILLARYEGKGIAGGLFFLHNGTIHHAYSCSLREYLRLAPNDLIQWHMIKWGNEQGFHYLDSGRSRENEGTVLFKKRWGGEVLGMPYFYKFCKKRLNERQEVRYRWLSHLWSKYMPGLLANRIGPWIVKQVG